MAILSQPDSLSSAEAIRVAIILPTHRHSGLLPEALDTALSQQTDFPYAVVIVNDGCPFPETDRVCREFAAAHPGRIYYLHTRNNGLSDARNTGIDFALAAFPALDAVYFLDSDNRIRPHLLQRLSDALRRAERNVGWAYPDIDKFGFAEFCDTSGPYSPLEHLFRNVSEAGSMVSRRMLDAGLRFDEAMRQGYEDWEFWLQGLENGFRGVHVPCAGFGYRRRGESMLVDAERDVRPITDHIRARHPGLFGVKALARLEATVSRRYAIFLPDAGVLRYVTEPRDIGEEQPLNTFVRRLLRVPERPDYGRCPGHIVVMDSAFLDLLATHRLLKGVLWTLERAAAQATIVTCLVALDKRAGLSLAWRGEAILANSHPPPRPHADARIITLHTQTLLDLARLHPAHGLEFRREPCKPCHEARLHLHLGIPDPPALRPSAMDGLAALHRALAETWTRDEYCGWSAAQLGRFRSHVAMPADIYRDTHRLASVLPVLPTGTGREAALVIDPTRSGQSLPVTARLAAWLRQHGWGVHLVAMGTGQFAGPPGAVLVQRLPALARGLVGVDLHVAQSGAGGGALLASLLAVDTGRVLADWRVPFADLCPGWLPLRLPAASSQPDRVLELRVCCLAVDAAPPSLSLAPTGLLDEFSLRIDPEPAAASVHPDRDPVMLALRLWGGLPGIAYDPAANLTTRPLPASVTFALPDHVVAQVHRTCEGSAPFPWFGYLGGGKVLSHPLRAGVVAACIPVRSMPGLVSVACEALIEDPRCKTPIACKLVVAAPEIAVDDAGREESVLASSGRMVLEAPLRPHLLTARLREPCHGPVHLYLFSDIPDGGPGHYGRAVFTRFRVEIDEQAAWSMPPALARARDGVG